MQTLEQKLDLLIHAHDVQGLGHVSRSIAIGLAVRRLSPELRVLLVTGCQAVGALIGSAPLDWVKLPSYKTVVKDGRSEIQFSDANLSFPEVITLRGEMLRIWISLLHPRCVLVDNRPKGQSNELLNALKSPYCSDIRWVLGMRAILGKVTDVWTEEAASIFREYYSGLLWYGDTTIHGLLPKRKLEDHFGCDAYETGFVSRAEELEKWGKIIQTPSEKLVGTAAFSWCSYETLTVLESFLEVLQQFEEELGYWRIFIGSGCEGERKNKIFHDLYQLQHCSVELVSDQYLASLKNSSVSLVYAGYNTLTDLLWSKTPAVLIVRNVVSREQEMHMQILSTQVGNSVLILKEKEINPDLLYLSLRQQMRSIRLNNKINLDGAEVAARYLITKIRQQS